MHKYTLIISYDGTEYYGWQSQKDLPAVASTMQHIFAKIFGRSIVLRGASRTDAGVHALGQVAMFKTDLDLDPEQIKCAWNNRLPADIVIRSLQRIDISHSIYDNIAHKTYHYHFFLERPLPFVQRYGWHFYHSIDLQKLEIALQTFVGTHDFRSFCSSEDTRENTMRTVDAITLEYIQRYGVYRITVRGHSFLRHMIRRMVGAALEVASRPTLPIGALQEALDQKDPEQILPNAPAQGLMLYKITYKK